MLAAALLLLTACDSGRAAARKKQAPFPTSRLKTARIIPAALRTAQTVKDKGLTDVLFCPDSFSATGSEQENLVNIM